MIIEKVNWSTIKSKLEKLFEESYGRQMQSGYLDWRYFDNNQDQILFSVELSEGGLSGSYSAFPLQLIANGKLFQAAMSMTTMTRPDSRGRGIFQNLAEELYMYAQDLQISGVFGFPNSKSHATFRHKLNWSDIYEIPTMELGIDGANLNKLALSSEVGRDDSFFLSYPDAPKDNLIRVNRTKDYLSWRYAKNPVNKYQNFTLSKDGEVSSYVVTKLYEGGLDLVDIQSKNSSEAKILLEHILKLSFMDKVRKISCWAPAHHDLHTVLEKIGFENSAPVTYFGGREILKYAMPYGWQNYQNWYIQMGDSDVY